MLRSRVAISLVRAPRCRLAGAWLCVCAIFAGDGSFAAGAPDGIIAEAARVRELRPEEARRSHRALIRGVVTTSNADSCVVQDASGPVFVRPVEGAWTVPPAAGELWEFGGATHPGEFSPIIVADHSVRHGRQDLPRPLRPGWEQLINGSLDVELVEVRGALLERSDAALRLLVAGGEVAITAHPGYPLPEAPLAADADPPAPRSLVRVRGVFFAYRDPATRQLVPGRFLLGDARLVVDEPAPADPFERPTRSVADLLRFDASADLPRWVKIAGQVLHSRPGECFLRDGDKSVRALVGESPGLSAGDFVEVVGFPQPGRPSPVLVEAVVRKTGHGELPAPRDLSDDELADEKHDAARVRFEARVVGEHSRLGERVLEMQAGRHRFLAKPGDDGTHGNFPRPEAHVRLTGVYAGLSGDAARSGWGKFEILLNSPEDIELLKNGPRWTRRHVFGALAVLSGGTAVLFVWVLALRRTVARRTALLETEVRERERAEQAGLLDRERARVARDLHDELGAGLTQIGLIGSLAAQPGAAPERARSHAEFVAAKARDLVGVLDEIVWALDPKHDTAASVRGYFCDYAEEFLRPAGIVCRFEADSSGPGFPLDARQRHGLFLAFKEALTNVVKHAAATEVRIRVSADASALNVDVADDGKGLTPGPTATTANGVANMRARLEQIGGACEVGPRACGGTLVSFRVPAAPSVRP